MDKRQGTATRERGTDFQFRLGRSLLPLLALLVASLLSCAKPRASVSRPADDAATAAIRVMLASNVSAADVGATGAWFMLDPERRLMVRVGANDQWRIERSGDR